MRVRLLFIVAVLSLASCAGAPTLHQPAPAASPTSSAPPVSLAVTPAKAASGVPVSVEIGVSITNGTLTSVALVDTAGNAVKGRMRDDNSSWVPDQPLKYATGYTATVTVSNQDGQPVTETSEFTTMNKPSKKLGTGLYLSNGQTYGVAMPVVIEFTSNVPESARPAIQSRLFVKTNPPQPGVWHWASPKQIFYRAKEYWQPGTTIEVRSALEGVPIGDGRYGDTDRRATAKIRKDRIEMITDDSAHQMTVKKNGEVIKTIPVSLGKDATPSSSGTMVIMQKYAKTVFDTTDEPDATDLYRVEVEYAQRLTWGGEFIHAAPWSVQHQGKRNVSHGCTNVSMANAKWLYDLTLIGDPVTVKGTPRKLKSGNGFTVWSLSWEDYIKGSALPVVSA